MNFSHWFLYPGGDEQRDRDFEHGTARPHVCVHCGQVYSSGGRLLGKISVRCPQKIREYLRQHGVYDPEPCTMEDLK